MRQKLCCASFPYSSYSACYECNTHVSMSSTLQIYTSGSQGTLAHLQPHCIIMQASTHASQPVTMKMIMVAMLMMMI